MNIYDTEGNVTREGAESVIRSGGSVSIKGKLYTTIEKLPDDASFAAGSPESEATAREKLAKTIADAQAQLTRLGPPGAVVEVGHDSPNVKTRPHAGKS